MGVLVDLLAVAVVALVVLLGWGAVRLILQRSENEAIRRARWMAEHYSLGGQTYVVVRKHLPQLPAAKSDEDSHTVAVLENADPGWEEKFHEAMAAARMRAAALNSEIDLR